MMPNLFKITISFLFICIWYINLTMTKILSFRWYARADCRFRQSGRWYLVASCSSYRNYLLGKLGCFLNFPKNGSPRIDYIRFVVSKRWWNHLGYSAQFSSGATFIGQSLARFSNYLIKKFWTYLFSSSQGILTCILLKNCFCKYKIDKIGFTMRLQRTKKNLKILFLHFQMKEKK